MSTSRSSGLSESKSKALDRKISFGSKPPRLDVYTAVNPKYESFIPLFVWSTLLSNPRAICTIGVENIESVTARHRKAFDWLRAHFANRFQLFEVGFSASVTPNSVRFLEFPDFSSEYVYICDVDFLVTQDIIAINEETMRESNLPFNNIVRPKTRRLTGLHFTRTNALWTPLSGGLEVTEELLRGNDEELLYHLVSERLGLEKHQLKGGSRPIPGLHLSLFSRFPLGGINPISGAEWVGWGGASPEDVLSMIDDSWSREFENLLQPESRLHFTLARSWALACVAHNGLSIDADLIPALTGNRRLNERAAQEITELKKLNDRAAQEIAELRGQKDEEILERLKVLGEVVNRRSVQAYLQLVTWMDWISGRRALSPNAKKRKALDGLIESRGPRPTANTDRHQRAPAAKIPG